MSCAYAASGAAGLSSSLHGVTDVQGVGTEVVAVGSIVRIRNLRLWDTMAEVTVTIVAPGDGGLYRLTPNTLLGRALIGHRPGDIVHIKTEACTVDYEIVMVARVAEPADAALLKSAPEKGPGSTPGARTNGERTVRVGDVVHVRDGQLEEWWRIVPADMADVLTRWMSAETPMARALLGHRAGEVVRVDRPGGRSPVTLLAVESRGEA